MLVELTNTVFVNSTNITTNIETVALSTLNRFPTTRILQLVRIVNRVRPLGKRKHCTCFDRTYLEQGAIQGLCGLFSHFLTFVASWERNLGNFCMVAFSFSWRLQDRFLTMWLRLDFHTALVNCVDGDCALFSWTTIAKKSLSTKGLLGENLLSHWGN